MVTMEAMKEELDKFMRPRKKRYPKNSDLKKIKPQEYRVFGVFLSWRTGSNRRPADYKSAALPAELRQQI